MVESLLKSPKIFPIQDTSRLISRSAPALAARLEASHARSLDPPKGRCKRGGCCHNREIEHACVRPLRSTQKPKPEPKGNGTLSEMHSTGRRACVFCGRTGSLTREHVFGGWLSKIGLDYEPAETIAGAHNRIGKGMGTSRPFQAKVKNVCAECNNGWMSRLEGVAQRVLTPLVLGEPGHIERSDQGAITGWMQKTALMAMYLSSAEERAAGHGLPSSEYKLLYENRERREPSRDSKFWVASYAGALGQGAVWVTPVAVNVEGLPEPELAHGYSMTVAVGALILHGVRFTDLPFDVEVDAAAPCSDLAGHGRRKPSDLDRGA